MQLFTMSKLADLLVTADHKRKKVSILCDMPGVPAHLVNFQPGKHRFHLDTVKSDFPINVNLAYPEDAVCDPSSAISEFYMGRMHVILPVIRFPHKTKHKKTGQHQAKSLLAHRQALLLTSPESTSKRGSHSRQTIDSNFGFPHDEDEENDNHFDDEHEPTNFSYTADNDGMNHDLDENFPFMFENKPQHHHVELTDDECLVDQLIPTNSLHHTPPGQSIHLKLQPMSESPEEVTPFISPVSLFFQPTNDSNVEEPETALTTPTHRSAKKKHKVSFSEHMEILAEENQHTPLINVTLEDDMRREHDEEMNALALRLAALKEAAELEQEIQKKPKVTLKLVDDMNDKDANEHVDKKEDKPKQRKPRIVFKFDSDEEQPTLTPTKPMKRQKSTPIPSKSAQLHQHE
ncbi:hypothetical protein BLNAU_7829 [Blattamonas nauphoetae]|uniref:Uncharacterized protein n=1 Tax=Blattamonas nauphoetae TaxID=2049346 RepID=A0ABQ9Y0I2_9EUKA|nr:hypothetical protein BLNAU_7829 [Blattamonas nauphoetae]